VEVGESGKVVGIEHIEELVKSSIDTIRQIPRLAARLDDGRIRIVAGDGRRGYSVVAPYDAIHVGAAAPELPPAVSQIQHTHTHPFNRPLSGTTRVSRYQKGKTNLDFTEAREVSGSGISWAICKSAPSSRPITMPASHHSVFYRPDALPAAQPTASKH